MSITTPWWLYNVLDTTREAVLHSKQVRGPSVGGECGLKVLSAREKNILNLIVGDYIKEVAPVASQSIARKHHLGVSPATIRNDVADLAHEGYITRPHPSAGSVPLEKGYRAYVETIGERRTQLPAGVRDSIHNRLVEVEWDVEDWTAVAATLLAGLVGNLAIVSFPKSQEARVKHIELVPLQDLLALLIVVFEQATLRRQLIRFEQPVDPAALQASASRVRELVVGRSGREVESEQTDLPPLEDEFVSATAEMLREEDRAEHRDHYVDGLRNLLAQPEFAASDKVPDVVGGVEDGSLAQAVLDETPEVGEVRVVIGQENRGDMLWPFSVVVAQYGIPADATGTVGAIGPVRMEYARAIACVELMVGVMSELVEGVRGT